MEQSFTGRRTLVPKPQPHVQGIQSLNAQPLATSLSTSTIPVQPVSRQPKSNTKTDQEWEHQRPNIEQLYVTDDLSLPDVMREMEGKYHFKASRKQYNNKISQWRIGKNVKTNEMRAIVRKTRQRQMENPPKASVFRVRSRPVDPDKIERFKKDKGIEEDVVMADAATPSDISCITPQLSNSEIPGQSSYPLFDGSSRNPFSPVEPTASSASCQPTFSSNLPVVSSNPAFGQLGVGQPLAYHNLKLNHRLSFSSPRLNRHSPVYQQWSLSSLLDPAQTSQCPLSPYVGRQAKSNLTDPFLQPIAVEPAVSGSEWASAFASYSDRSRSSPRTALGNCVADLIHSLMLRLNTYEDQRQHGELGSNSPVINSYSEVRDSQWDGCVFCKGWRAATLMVAFFQRTNAPPGFPWSTTDQDFSISKVLRALIPVIQSEDKEIQHQDGERIARAIVQELERRPNLDVKFKGLVILTLFEILERCGRREQAKQLVEDSMTGNAAPCRG